MRSLSLALALGFAVASSVSLAGESASAIALSIDNDLFAPTRTDRDYTAGVAITYSSNSEALNNSLVSRAVGAIDQGLVGSFGRLPDQPENTSVEFGAYGFTPEEITEQGIDRSDRPYSSLVYLSTSRSYQSAGGTSGWTTSLTVGALGLDLFEHSQNAIHKATGSDKPEGWDHQISEGGEPTLRYSAAYHQYLDGSEPGSKFKVTYFGSVGYLTEFGAALVFRGGLISSPDNRFNPELMAYGERAPSVSAVGGRENYFWGGLSVKARAYNAFLQGQFRDSDHELSANDPNVLLAEVWAGHTHTLWDNMELSYVLRVQSSEIKNGTGDRTLAWGGLVLSKRFGSH